MVDVQLRQIRRHARGQGLARRAVQRRGRYAGGAQVDLARFGGDVRAIAGDAGKRALRFQ